MTPDLVKCRYRRNNKNNGALCLIVTYSLGVFGLSLTAGSQVGHSAPLAIPRPQVFQLWLCFP